MIVTEWFGLSIDFRLVTAAKTVTIAGIDQLVDGRNRFTRPCPAVQKQAGNTIIETQQTRNFRVWCYRRNDLLNLGHRSAFLKIIVSRDSPEVLQFVMLHEARIDEPLLKLHRHLVFEVHNQRMGDGDTLMQFERIEQFGRRFDNVEGDDFGAVLPATRLDFIGDVDDFDQRRFRLRGATKVPTP